MGDPRRQKKKYVSPKRPFDSDRFEQELELVGSYGLRNKKELWKHRTDLSNYRRTARKLQGLSVTERAQLESELIEKLVRYGILIAEPSLDSVLDLTLENLLARRLQTIVFRKGLAASLHHARQLVTHGHISLDGSRVMTPARLITSGEEDRIAYSAKSSLNDESHPARIAARDVASRTPDVSDESDDEPRRGRSAGAEPVTNKDLDNEEDNDRE